MHPGCPHTREELGQNQYAYCHQKGSGRMNVPNWSVTPKVPPRSEAEARLLKENISPPTGEPAHGRKTLSDWQAWKALTGTPGAYSLNEDTGPSHLSQGRHGYRTSGYDPTSGPTFQKAYNYYLGYRGLDPLPLLSDYKMKS
jgi:hypothetical protein